MIYVRIYKHASKPLLFIHYEGLCVNFVVNGTTCISLTTQTTVFLKPTPIQKKKIMVWAVIATTHAHLVANWFYNIETHLKVTKPSNQNHHQINHVYCMSLRCVYTF